MPAGTGLPCSNWPTTTLRILLTPAIGARSSPTNRPRRAASGVGNEREKRMRSRLDADEPRFVRRAVLGGGSAALLASVSGGPSAAEDSESPNGPLSEIPIVLPKTEFVYEALFDLEPVMMLGQGPLGERRIIPIAGGVFAGPRIKGKILPGGADRQLVRKDGAKLLNALYELQTDDGAVITVNNRVLIDKRPDGTPYVFSSIDITAPGGPHDWLNHLVFVGTLHGMVPKPKVLIRVCSLT
jgi:hypothetical protein